jgi:Uma2 family endonuclease
MSVIATNGTRAVEPIVYPESDGKPMADNTKQMRWINMLSNNLEGMFHDAPDVFVACNLMWYAVEDEPEEYVAPDVMIAFNRPKGDRGSYRQWEENDVPVTVAFEILSPSNDRKEMIDKLLFYDSHGVEEYYVYDPEKNTLDIYRRGRAALVLVRDIAGYVSRRMGIRFQMTTPEMTVSKPNGERFLIPAEIEAERDAARKRAEAAERREGVEKQRADDAERRETLLRARFARIAELAPKMQSGRATPDELAEFARLTTPERG